MPDPIDVEVQKHSEDSIQRELWGTRIGFILAAVGSVLASRPRNGLVAMIATPTIVR